ncbi:MAG: ABC transporter permease, partial [Thiobacillus sp.]|nr:ABC transporter permease [Thiobacillus sp.]
MRAWLERQRGLVDFTVAAMARRRGRNLGLFAAYCMVVFLLASVVLFGDALRHQAEVLLADAPEVVVQRLTAGRHDLIAGDSLAALRGVREQHGRLWGYYYDPALGANYTVMVPPAAEAPVPGTAVLG